MRIATWNVNSVRARLPRILHWLETTQPDVVCLQETKCRDDQFPREPIEDLGYSIETFGQPTYNGVAILSRPGIEDVVRGFPGDAEDAQKRVIGATVGDVMLLNLYVVNGEAVGSPKYDFKLEWLERLHAFVAEHYPLQQEKVVLCGDFNITFDDRDMLDPEANRGKVFCSEPERSALARLCDLGLHDAFRRFHEEAGLFTWWDFRTRGFQRDDGLRIDHFLMSDSALAACTDVEIEKGVRGGEKPSDHAPVTATLK